MVSWDPGTESEDPEDLELVSPTNDPDLRSPMFTSFLTDAIRVGMDGGVNLDPEEEINVQDQGRGTS